MKHAFIAGGMGAVGQVAARTLAERDYTLTLTYHSQSSAEAENFLKTLSGTGHRAMKLDLTDADAVKAAVQEVPSYAICLYTAADRIVRKPVSKETVEEFRGQFEATLFGLFCVGSAILPRMEKSGIFVGVTTSALDGSGGAMGGYRAAKAAAEALLRDFAREYEKASIRVNALAPDFMRTALTADLPARLFEMLAEHDPRGRLTTPEDVAERLLYLVEGEGRELSGVSLDVVSGATRPL